MMGAIGTGNVREGVVTLSLGTSVHCLLLPRAARTRPNRQRRPLLLLLRRLAPARLHHERHQRRHRKRSRPSAKPSPTSTPPSTATTPGADGLVFLPFLNGERTPDLPNARGTLTGISANNLTADNLIRAAIEGVSFGILNGLDSHRNGGTARDRIHVIGGGCTLRAHGVNCWPTPPEPTSKSPSKRKPAASAQPSRPSTSTATSTTHPKPSPPSPPAA